MYLSGTDEYIEFAVKEYSPALLRAAYAVLRNTADAEDAVQEAFVKLLQKRPVFENVEHEKAWLIKVTVNISKNMLRHSSRECALTREILHDVSEEPSKILNEVFSLPLKYRTVIHLYYYEGYSIKEIAAIMNIPSATAGTLLSRGRKKLEKILKGEEAL